MREYLRLGWGRGQKQVTDSEGIEVLQWLKRHVQHSANDVRVRTFYLQGHGALNCAGNKGRRKGHPPKSAERSFLNTRHWYSVTTDGNGDSVGRYELALIALRQNIAATHPHQAKYIEPAPFCGGRDDY